MKTLPALSVMLLAAALIVSLTGCGGVPKSEVEKLVDRAVDTSVPGWGQIDEGVVNRLVGHAEEAIPLLMKKIDECPKYAQDAYSTIVTCMKAEPARFEACKELLTHPNPEVRKDAVEGMAMEGAPDEAIKECIRLTTEASETSLRSVALYAISSRKDKKKYAREICKALRRATTDPEQDVREHATRGLARYGCR